MIENERPWLNEPDRLEFESHGFPCIIQRVAKEFSGHLCGYVGVDEKHPYFGKGYYDLDIEAHGGITFSGEIEDSPCNLWWFGFDAAHCFDLTPWNYEQRQPGGLFHSFTEGNKILGKAEAYRDMNYMKGECESLAKQLSEASENHDTK